LYSQADLLVHPSLLEGFGKVILEAMAMGLPVIATTASAGEYIIEDGIDGLLVPPGDIEALKSKILLVYENRDLAEQMGKKAASKARCFTWENYGKGIVESVMKAWQQG
jgi:glycosyltransferase involved in cell wall biosynthesis